jgi:hypothetical protein
MEVGQGPIGGCSAMGGGGRLVKLEQCTVMVYIRKLEIAFCERQIYLPQCGSIVVFLI